MRTALRIACSITVAGLAAVAAFAGDPHEGQLPKTPAEALEWSKAAIEAARKAKQAETPDIGKGIKRAVDWMQPHMKAGSADSSWGKAWNEALTLSRFHGNKPSGDYAMTPSDVIVKTMSCGLPTGRGWSYVNKSPGKGEQCWSEITRTMADKRVAVTVQISIYRFDTVYSDVGGENATGLAKMGLEFDKTKFAKVESGGTQILAKPMNKAFPRAQTYEIVGVLADGTHERLRCYYAKTSFRTYLFEVKQFRDTAATDSPFEAWQKGVEDPELEAVLASVEEPDPKKK